MEPLSSPHVYPVRQRAHGASCPAPRESSRAAARLGSEGAGAEEQDECTTGQAWGTLQVRATCVSYKSVSRCKKTTEVKPVRPKGNYS